jgi:hypothetical protein
MRVEEEEASAFSMALFITHARYHNIAIGQAVSRVWEGQPCLV